MLVLNRKRSQKIVIDGNIEVQVLEIRGNAVKLGFVCPPEVTVHREEVARRISQTVGEEGPHHAPLRLTGLEEPRPDALAFC